MDETSSKNTDNSETTDLAQLEALWRQIKKEPRITLVERKYLEILPGSAEALVSDCICDPIANNDGIGLFAGQLNWSGKIIYSVKMGCPIHDAD